MEEGGIQLGLTFFLLQTGTTIPSSVKSYIKTIQKKENIQSNQCGKTQAIYPGQTQKNTRNINLDMLVQ